MAGSMTLSRLAPIRDRRHCADLLLSSTGQQYPVILHLEQAAGMATSCVPMPRNPFALTIPYELARLAPDDDVVNLADHFVFVVVDILPKQLSLHAPAIDDVIAFDDGHAELCLPGRLRARSSRRAPQANPPNRRTTPGAVSSSARFLGTAFNTQRQQRRTHVMTDKSGGTLKKYQMKGCILRIRQSRSGASRLDRPLALAS